MKIEWGWVLIYQMKKRAFCNSNLHYGRLRLKRDGTRAETTFRLLAKRTSPFKSVGASVKSTTGQPRSAHQR